MIIFIVSQVFEPKIICLWRNILKIIIIEISLKWIKFRGYLSVFSCILTTVWPKFLPLDLWPGPARASQGWASHPLQPDQFASQLSCANTRQQLFCYRLQSNSLFTAHSRHITLPYAYAWTWSLPLFSCPFVLRVNGCVYFYSLQYFCSQTSKKAKIRFTNCICVVINLACSFLLNGPKASNHLLHRTSVWEHWWRMKKPGKL